MRVNDSKANAKGASRSQYPTPEEMIAHAIDLVPMLIEDQAETELRTYYSPQTHERFVEAGFYKMLVPKRFGGYEMDLKLFYQVMTVVASGCPSTVWQLCFGASQAKIVATIFDLETQAQIFGDGHFISPFRSLPTGLAEPTANGGWKVTNTREHDLTIFVTCSPFR